MKTIILDAGHGGIIDGEYQTSGKRSPVWPDKRQLFEGEFNRAIVERVIALCEPQGIRTYKLIETEDDMPLESRTAIINAYCEHAGAILISIHANAGGGTGFEVFTSVGNTDSDDYAEKMIIQYAEAFPELRLRKDESDGDLDKEAQFRMLRKTVCPAMLIECAFMDTLNPDCELLMSEEGRDRMAYAIYEGIKSILND